MIERTHESVLRYVEGLLTRGELAPGDRLPAERVLAERLGVGRPSVREALKVLAALGVVQASPGQGRGSAALVVARPAAAMGAALRLHARTASLPIDDLVDTRVLLEAASVRALAVRVRREGDGDGVLARPRELLAAMAAPGLAAADFHTLDTAFHVALAEAAGNAVVTAIMAALREAVEGYVLRAVPALADWDTAAAGLRAEHTAVLDAVASGQADAAAGLVERHIRGFITAARSGVGVTG